MSRIGIQPIDIPDGVRVSVAGNCVTVEGPKGKLEQGFRPEVSMAVEDEQVIVRRQDNSKAAKSYHGLYRNLVANMVAGVTEGFTKTLLINGVGYRAELRENVLVLNLGYSNPIQFGLAEGLTATLDGNAKITISGIDRQAVGQACAEIRSLRPPEPYKGKGVRYEGEYVRRKIGKAGVT